MRFTEDELRTAVTASLSYAEALRRLGLRPAGGNHGTLKKYVALWDISIAHFDAYGTQRRGGLHARTARPLSEILVEHSTYSRSQLKDRLYREGLKTRECELCGQGSSGTATACR